MKKMKHGGKARKTHKRMQDGGMANYAAPVQRMGYTKGKVGTSAYRPVPGVAGSADSTQAGMPVPTPIGGFRGPGVTYRPAFNKGGADGSFDDSTAREMSPREMARVARREERYAERDARRDARRNARLGVGNYSGPSGSLPGAMNPSVAPPMVSTMGGSSGAMTRPAFNKAAIVSTPPEARTLRKGGAVKGKNMRGGGLARKGVGMALAKGGLARRAGGCAKRGVGRGKMV